MPCCKEIKRISNDNQRTVLVLLLLGSCSFNNRQKFKTTQPLPSKNEFTLLYSLRVFEIKLTTNEAGNLTAANLKPKFTDSCKNNCNLGSKIDYTVISNQSWQSFACFFEVILIFRERFIPVLVT